ncbi:MAG: hypothetical protein H6732_05000 [Alphaproteobacteria bacterium]|nr:hypothetical protein [Alphaproteobacteria bacterium]
MRAVLPAVFALAACAQLPQINDSLTWPPRRVPSLVELEEEVVVETRERGVDLLVVLDTSASNFHQIPRLVAAMPSLFGVLAAQRIDWHLGLITTDTERDGPRGRLVEVDGLKVLDAHTAEVAGAFARLVEAAPAQREDEQGLQAVTLTLRNRSVALQEANVGFRRKGAALHALVYTDEDDGGAVSPEEVADLFAELALAAGAPTSLSAISGTKNAGCVLRDADGDVVSHIEAGTAYVRAAEQTGGLFRSYCTWDLGPALADVGEHASLLRRSYPLSQRPRAGTLEVEVALADTVLVGLDADATVDTAAPGRACAQPEADRCFPYTYDAQQNAVVVTGWVPPKGAELTFRYELEEGAPSREEEGSAGREGGE